MTLNELRVLLDRIAAVEGGELQVVTGAGEYAVRSATVKAIYRPNESGQCFVHLDQVRPWS